MLKGLWLKPLEKAKRYKLIWGRIGFDGDNRGERSELRTPGPHQQPGIKNKRKQR